MLDVKRLLKQVPAWSLKQHSFANYHAEGLNYLCIHRDIQLTIKAYIFEENLVNNRGDYVVWPHSHRYYFSSLTLSGAVVNHMFCAEIGAGDGGHVMYTYDAESRKVSRVTDVTLKALTSRVYRAGNQDFFYMESNEIHTLTVPEPTIVLQYQYADTVNKSLLFAPKNVKVDCESNLALYKKPSTDVVESWRERVLGVL